MRTSLNEIKKIEDYLFERGEVADRLMFDANKIIDKSLWEKVSLQKRVYNMIRWYGRKKLKAEIEAVHYKLFHEPQHSDFKRSILNIFKS